MKRISLDLVHPPRRPWGRVWLAAGICALGAALAVQLRQSVALADLQRQERELGEQVRHTHQAPEADFGGDQVARSRFLAAQAELAVPWEPMFRALEQTRAEAQKGGHRDPVSMQAIEPDARAGTVLISGEVSRLEEASAYLERLGSTPPFSDVFMLSHRAVAGRPDGAVRFVIEAQWRRP